MSKKLVMVFLITTIAVLAIIAALDSMMASRNAKRNSRIISGMSELSLPEHHGLSVLYGGGSKSGGSLNQVVFFDAIYQVVSESERNLPDGFMTEVMAVIQQYLEQEGASILQESGGTGIGFNETPGPEHELSAQEVLQDIRYFSVGRNPGFVDVVLIERDYEFQGSRREGNQTVTGGRVIGQLLITLSICQ